MKLAVIGMGVVGRAQVEMFAGPLGITHEVITYDITDERYPAAEIAGCHFAVITVGTPSADNGACDMSQVDDAIARLPRDMPVLIRSTVLPGTTARWQEKRKGTPFCVAPEFMHERKGGAWQKPTDVPFMLLGGTDASVAFFRPKLELVYHGRISTYHSTDVEMAKYVANLHWAMRVTFVNEMSRISAALGADWDEVRDAWLQDERLGTSEYTLMAGYEPGFGGRCWPKDLSALASEAKDKGYEAGFLAMIYAANAWFRAGH